MAAAEERVGTGSANTGEAPLPFGVYAETGRPLESIDSASLAEFSKNPSAEQPDRLHLETKQTAASTKNFSVVADVDANNLGEAGWAVMFAPSVEASVRDALQPLLDLRQKQVGDDRLFKVFDAATGTTYQPGQGAAAWLAARNVSMNVVNPLAGVPFFLLLVGPPDEIPFEFQYSLDIFWAVGRLWFDTPEEFRQYADSVVRYETEKAISTSRSMTVFAPCHDFDAATQLFCRQVAKPLALGSDIDAPIGLRQHFGVTQNIGQSATRDTLRDVLRGKGPLGTPSILLTGSHGVAFAAADDPQLPAKQGALVCQDWDGYGKLTDEQWFAASDVPTDAKVHGMVHVLFACYGGGCPQYDNFSRAVRPSKAIAPKAMLSKLPQTLLTHPEGGMLASLAHVERAWAYSFQSDRGGPQTQGFRDVLTRLMRGDRIGQAVDAFNGRWAALTTDLAEVLDDINHNVQVPPDKLASMWVARDDARNYIVLGDPAVRLRVDDMPAT